MSSNTSSCAHSFLGLVLMHPSSSGKNVVVSPSIAMLSQLVLINDKSFGCAVVPLYRCACGMLLQWSWGIGQVVRAGACFGSTGTLNFKRLDFLANPNYKSPKVTLSFAVENKSLFACTMHLPLSFSLLFAFLGLASAQFNIFEQMFGGGGQQQHHQQQNAASDSSFYRSQIDRSMLSRP